MNSVKYDGWFMNQTSTVVRWHVDARDSSSLHACGFARVFLFQVKAAGLRGNALGLNLNATWSEYDLPEN